MPILTYELGARSTPNDRSTTGARDGYVAAIIKQDSELRPAQVYSELAANRLAQFLGLPVAVGVAVQSQRMLNSLRFASLKASESELDYYDFTDYDTSFDEISDVNIVPGMHIESGHVIALREVCERYPLETAQIAVFDLWIGNDDRPGNLKAELSKDNFGAIFAMDQGASLLSCAPRRHQAIALLNSYEFPRYHAFQKLVSPMYCGEMIERISTIPDWAMHAAMTYDDNVGSVTIAEQYEVCEILKTRRTFLRDLVTKVLL
ncbi:MAG: hypothetical protein PHO76_09070 [Methylotenera sp.]|nr:hypothetical protein [Methylotenera sp.]MDD4925912.1 hypothetical protein [Methylotenera sp.]